MNTNTHKTEFKDCAHVNWELAGRTTDRSGFDIDYQKIDNLQVYCKDCETYLNLKTKKKLDDKRLTTFRRSLIDQYRIDMKDL